MSVLEKLGLAGTVFETTWQGRLVAIVSTLDEGGAIRWSELKASIDSRPTPENGTPTEFDAWIRALEVLLIERGLFSELELQNHVEAVRAEKQAHDEHHHDGHRH